MRKKYIIGSMVCIATAAAVVVVSANGIFGNTTSGITTSSKATYEATVASEENEAKLAAIDKNLSAAGKKAVVKEDTDLNEFFEGRAVVNTDKVKKYLNIRSAAVDGEEAESIGRIYPGAAVEVLNKNDKWTRITSGSVKGWVKTEYLLFGEDAANAVKGDVNFKAVVQDTDTEVYSNPNKKSNVIEVAKEGKSYEVVEKTSNWVEAVTEEGSSVYLPTEAVSLEYNFDGAVSTEEVYAENSVLTQEEKETESYVYDETKDKWIADSIAASKEAEASWLAESSAQASKEAEAAWLAESAAEAARQAEAAEVSKQQAAAVAEASKQQAAAEEAARQAAVAEASKQQVAAEEAARQAAAAEASKQQAAAEEAARQAAAAEASKQQAAAEEAARQAAAQEAARQQAAAEEASRQAAAQEAARQQAAAEEAARQQAAAQEAARQQAAAEEAARQQAAAQEAARQQAAAEEAARQQAAAEEAARQQAAAQEAARQQAAAEEAARQQAAAQQQAQQQASQQYLGKFRITHYCSCPICCGRWSNPDPNATVIGASGMPLTPYSSLSVDPNQIPYGSKVMFNGSVYVAADTGVGANCIDVYCGRDHATAASHGMYYADVYLLK